MTLDASAPWRMKSSTRAGSLHRCRAVSPCWSGDRGAVAEQQPVDGDGLLEGVRAARAGGRMGEDHRVAGLQVRAAHQQRVALGVGGIGIDAQGQQIAHVGEVLPGDGGIQQPDSPAAAPPAGEGLALCFAAAAPHLAVSPYAGGVGVEPGEVAAPLVHHLLDVAHPAVEGLFEFRRRAPQRSRLEGRVAAFAAGPAVGLGQQRQQPRRHDEGPQAGVQSFHRELSRWRGAALSSPNSASPAAAGTRPGRR